MPFLHTLFNRKKIKLGIGQKYLFKSPSALPVSGPHLWPSHERYRGLHRGWAYSSLCRSVLPAVAPFSINSHLGSSFVLSVTTSPRSSANFAAMLSLFVAAFSCIPISGYPSLWATLAICKIHTNLRALTLGLLSDRKDIFADALCSADYMLRSPYFLAFLNLNLEAGALHTGHFSGAASPS